MSPAGCRLFKHQRIVRFGECDPAAAVYYPVFFDWFHQAMEAWFEEALEEPYEQVLKKLGFPAKKTSAEFFRPCRVGELIVVELWLSSLRTSSMMLEIEVKNKKDDELRARGSVLCVCIGLEQGKFQFQKTAIPQNLKEKMLPFLASS